MNASVHPWWDRRRTSPVWGYPASELELVYEDAAARGLIHPESQIDTVIVRPALGNDHQKLEAVRRANREWLGPWEATLPPGSTEKLPTAAEYRRRLERQMAESEALVMVIEVDGEVAGLVSIAGIQHGAMSQGNLGYWIGEKWAGQGVVSLAVAAVIDLVILRLGLHRLEINVRPENAPSLGLCHKLGLRHEGLRVRYMSIAGRWADHEGFAIDQEMLAGESLVTSAILKE